jgi:hypothetical protein
MKDMLSAYEDASVDGELHSTIWVSPENPERDTSDNKLEVALWDRIQIGVQAYSWATFLPISTTTVIRWAELDVSQDQSLRFVEEMLEWIQLHEIDTSANGDTSPGMAAGPDQQQVTTWATAQAVVALRRMLRAWPLLEFDETMSIEVEGAITSLQGDVPYINYVLVIFSLIYGISFIALMTKYDLWNMTEMTWAAMTPFVLSLSAFAATFTRFGEVAKIRINGAIHAPKLVRASKKKSKKYIGYYMRCTICK